jgi:hypothetical protein
VARIGLQVSDDENGCKGSDSGEPHTSLAKKKMKRSKIMKMQSQIHRTAVLRDGEWEQERILEDAQPHHNHLLVLGRKLVPEPSGETSKNGESK